MENNSKRRVEVILDREEDKPAVIEGLKYLVANLGRENVRWHIISCHHNPDELRMYALHCDADVVIAVGGETFILPTVLASWLQHFNKAIPVIGIALGDSEERDHLTLALSLEYSCDSAEGFLWNCARAVEGDHPSIKKKGADKKPPHFNMPLVFE